MTPPARDIGSGERAAAARAATRQVIAGLEAITAFASAEARPADGPRPAAVRGPGQDHLRLARTVCALRHVADRFAGISFAGVLDAADEHYRQLAAGLTPPATARRAQIADEAARVCDRSLSAPGQHSDGFWPPDTRAYLHGYASQSGQRLEETVAALTTRLLADLRHCADHQGTDFQQALAAGLTEYARQRLTAEGPFQTGRYPAPGHAPQATAPFPPCATSQGVVVSAADAEWLLVRTSARNHASEHAGLAPDRRDTDDERALTRALGDARRLHPMQLFAEVAPGIAARIMELKDGPAKAAALGLEHGHAHTPPYCDLSAEGDAAALMGALGETEPMTHANHQYRVLLATAYADAYQQAARHRPSPAESAARMAALDFPQTSPPTKQSKIPDPGTRSPATPQAPSRRGPRPSA